MLSWKRETSVIDTMKLLFKQGMEINVHDPNNQTPFTGQQSVAVKVTCTSCSFSSYIGSVITQLTCSDTAHEKLPDMSGVSYFTSPSIKAVHCVLQLTSQLAPAIVKEWYHIQGLVLGFCYSSGIKLT
jgi:hypothetical protein